MLPHLFPCLLNHAAPYVSNTVLHRCFLFSLRVQEHGELSPSHQSSCRRRRREMSCAGDGQAQNRGAKNVQWGQHLVGLEQNMCMEQALLAQGYQRRIHNDFTWNHLVKLWRIKFYSRIAQIMLVLKVQSVILANVSLSHVGTHSSTKYTVASSSNV